MHILLYSDGIFSQLSFGRVRFVFFQNQRAFLRRLSCSLKNLCVCVVRCGFIIPERLFSRILVRFAIYLYFYDKLPQCGDGRPPCHIPTA